MCAAPPAFELLPLRMQSRSLVRTPDLGSGRLGLETRGPGLGRKHVPEIRAPDGRARPTTPPQPSLAGGLPGSGKGGRKASILGTYFSPESSKKQHTFHMGAVLPPPSQP